MLDDVILPLNMMVKALEASQEDVTVGLKTATVTTVRNQELGGLARYECNRCGRNYKHLFHLKTHLRECSTEPLFSCEICHKKFYQERNLGRHRQKLHNEPAKNKL